MFQVVYGGIPIANLLTPSLQLVSDLWRNTFMFSSMNILLLLKLLATDFNIHDTCLNQLILWQIAQWSSISIILSTFIHLFYYKRELSPPIYFIFF